MKINNIPLSKGTEKLISEHKFSLKSFKGIEDILLKILQLHNKNHLSKIEFKKMLNACLTENKTNPKDIYYLSPDDIEIPWFDENKKSILIKDLRNSSTSFKQELNDLKKDIQYILFEDNAYQESLVPNINSMNFSNGKTTYSFTEIENYIKKHGFMFERGANRKIIPELINKVKIEFKENYLDKPCIVLHVFYVDSVSYTEDIIPLIFISLPLDPQKNFPYITCFNNAVTSETKNNKYEICGEQVSKKLFDRLASLDSFLGKRIKGTNKKVTYISSDTGKSPKDAIHCSLDDNLDNKERCYIIPSTLNNDEIECLRVSGSNELISSIYPKDSLMGKDISLIEIENSSKVLIYLDTLEKAEITIPGTDYMITNIDIVTNKFTPIPIAGKKYSRVKVDNDKFLFLDSIDLNPTTYNGTNEFMRHDDFRRIILGGKSIMILKNYNSTIFVDPKTGSKIEPKIAGTNDKITDFEFYMYRTPRRKNVVFKAQINDDKRVVIDQARKITNIDPNSLQRPKEISIKERIKLLETGSGQEKQQPDK